MIALTKNKTYQYEASYEAMGTNKGTQYEHSDKWYGWDTSMTKYIL